MENKKDPSDLRLILALSSFLATMLIIYFFVVPLVLSELGKQEKVIETNEKIIPEYKLVPNGVNLDTIWIYKIKNENER